MKLVPTDQYFSIALHPDKITVATGQGTGVRESGSDNILVGILWFPWVIIIN